MRIIKMNNGNNLSVQNSINVAKKVRINGLNFYDGASDEIRTHD